MVVVQEVNSLKYKVYANGWNGSTDEKDSTGEEVVVELARIKTAHGSQSIAKLSQTGKASFATTTNSPFTVYRKIRSAAWVRCFTTTD